jgi:DNA polymerase-1
MLLPQPQKRPVLDASLVTLSNVLSGTYTKTKLIIDKVNVNVIDTIEDVRELFQLLPSIPRLTMDIETTGLRVGRDRIITVAFAESELNGWAIPLCPEYWFEILTQDIEKYSLEDFENINFADLKDAFISLNGFEDTYSAISDNNDEFLKFVLDEYNTKSYESFSYVPNQLDYVETSVELNEEARELTKEFFENYTGEQVWQNHGFDIPFIIRDICKVSPTDYEEINNLINSWTLTDTMILKYLCVNGLERMSLGLKEFILPLYGEYDKDVDQAKLLEYSYYDVGKYNVYDTTATYEMYNTYSKLIHEEGQYEILKSYYEPSMKTLLKVKCKGLVVNLEKVVTADDKLIAEVDKQKNILQRNPYIQDVQEDLAFDAARKYNDTHVKQKTAEDFKIEFNPNSVMHKKELLIETLGYPVLETTKTGKPSLGKDTIKSYTQVEKDEEKLEILNAITEIANAAKVSGTFFKGFRTMAIEAPDNTHRIHADFKLTGTVSGRLSSANPNLQNLPSGSVLGKVLKETCDAPEGFVWTSSDYSSLEDFIIAEYTGDEVKKKILLDGYDSHSLYLASYIPEKLKELGLPYGDITKEESFIIKNDLIGKKLRDGHKAVTFALAYNGTEHTVAKALGIDLEEAKVIVDNYAKLHWRIKQKQREIAEEAKEVGYGITPFGLKIRSRQLQSDDETVAGQAMRSLTNAIYQGPAGMLTVKAMNKIQLRIEQAGYSNDIIIFNTIHDAIYAYVRHDYKILKWYNDNLIECMTEDYKDNQVLKLKANLDVGYHWADQRELPNNCSEQEIEKILELDKHKEQK